MLVLSRKKGEVVRIGDSQVVVVEIRGDKVKLGFEFPKEVVIHCEEIYQINMRRANETECK